MQTIHERIRIIRKAQGLNQKQFAQRLGITTSYMSRLEKGGSFPSETLIKLISYECKVSPDWLVTGEGKALVGEGPLLSSVIDAVLQFRDARNWKQFHSPKDLAISISLEASELLECFQWSGSDTQVESKKMNMQEELSDVLIYCIQLADLLQVDVSSLIFSKLEKNGYKYQVEKAYGSSKKYTELISKE